MQVLYVKLVKELLENGIGHTSGKGRSVEDTYLLEREAELTVCIDGKGKKKGHLIEI